MKKWILVLCLMFLISGTAMASERRHYTKTTSTDVDHNTLDYGEYLNLIVFETESTEWGVFMTHLNQSSESRFYVGGTVYLGRLFNKSKKKENTEE